MIQWGSIVRAFDFRGFAILVDDGRRVWRVGISTDQQPMIEQIGDLIDREFDDLMSATTTRRLEYLHEKAEGLF